ncbi:MAG TPA: IS481 family transposase [Candidatus Didemnitutus sp.]
MSQRLEFVLLARQPGVNFRELCRRFGISAKCGYKWRARFEEGGQKGLTDQCRRPHRCPEQYAGEVVGELVGLYQQWGWGGRKLRRRLQDLGRAVVPAASTCTAILRRAGQFAGREPRAGSAYRRFVRAQPNELWQMDHKGDFATQHGPRCYPLTVLDDHSRFNLVLDAAGQRTGSAVQAALTEAFATYGLPEAILCDHGSPWAAAEPVCPHTTFTVWLLRLGVRVLHGRPRHPQTQGKDERFHRTLEHELLKRHTWQDLAHCAREFPAYRQRYNCERPHDSLGGDTPVRHYRPSPRSLPPALPGLEYAAGLHVRTVRSFGGITFANQTWYVGRAFAGLAIGLRPSPQADGQWEVWFAHHLLGRIDLTLPLEPKHKLRSIYEE